MTQRYLNGCRHLQTAHRYSVDNLALLMRCYHRAASDFAARSAIYAQALIAAL